MHPRFSLQDVDLKSIRVFLAVCDNHGITAAQTDLNMAVSTISSSITHLEQRLGVKLCYRGRSGFSLTAEGERVYDAACEFMKSLNQFESQVSSAGEGMSGVLKLGALDTALNSPESPLMSALQRFAAQAPAVALQLNIHSSSTCEKLLLNGELDAALVCLPRKIEGVEYEFLFNEEQHLFCGRKHDFFAKDDNEITSQDLAMSKFVSRDMWLQIEASHFVSDKSHALINSIDAKSFLIRTGNYLGFMPVWFSRQLVEVGQLRSIRPRQFSWSAPYYLVTRSGGRRSRALSTFLDCIHAANSEHST